MARFRCLDLVTHPDERMSRSKSFPLLVIRIKDLGVGKFGRLESLRRILLAVRARNKNYDKSLTFSITVDVPKRNFADSLP